MECGIELIIKDKNNKSEPKFDINLSLYGFYNGIMTVKIGEGIICIERPLMDLSGYTRSVCEKKAPFIQAAERSLLAHIMNYGSPLEISEVIWRWYANNEKCKESNMLENVNWIHATIEGDLLSTIPDGFKNKPALVGYILQTLPYKSDTYINYLFASKSKNTSHVDYRISSLYAYLFAKSKPDGFERFIYYWMAIASLINYCSKGTLKKNNTAYDELIETGTDIDGIKAFAKKYLEEPTELNGGGITKEKWFQEIYSYIFEKLSSSGKELETSEKILSILKSSIEDKEDDGLELPFSSEFMDKELEYKKKLVCHMSELLTEYDNYTSERENRKNTLIFIEDAKKKSKRISKILNHGEDYQIKDAINYLNEIQIVIPKGEKEYKDIGVCVEGLLKLCEKSTENRRVINFLIKQLKKELDKVKEKNEDPKWYKDITYCMENVEKYKEDLDEEGFATYIAEDYYSGLSDNSIKLLKIIYTNPLNKSFSKAYSLQTEDIGTFNKKNLSEEEAKEKEQLIKHITDISNAKKEFDDNRKIIKEQNEKLNCFCQHLRCYGNKEFEDGDEYIKRFFILHFPYFTRNKIFHTSRVIPFISVGKEDRSNTVFRAMNIFMGEWLDKNLPGILLENHYTFSICTLTKKEKENFPRAICSLKVDSDEVDEYLRSKMNPEYVKWKKKNEIKIRVGADSNVGKLINEIEDDNLSRYLLDIYAAKPQDFIHFDPFEDPWIENRLSSTVFKISKDNTR